MRSTQFSCWTTDAAFGEFAIVAWDALPLHCTVCCNRRNSLYHARGYKRECYLWFIPVWGAPYPSATFARIHERFSTPCV